MLYLSFKNMWLFCKVERQISAGESTEFNWFSRLGLSALSVFFFFFFLLSLCISFTYWFILQFYVCLLLVYLFLYSPPPPNPHPGKYPLPAISDTEMVATFDGYSCTGSRRFSLLPRKQLWWLLGSCELPTLIAFSHRSCNHRIAFSHRRCQCRVIEKSENAWA